MDNIPICTDCIHCNEYDGEYACFRKQNKVNPVDGSEIFTKPIRCTTDRAEMFWAWWACGKYGKFFVHRDLYPATNEIEIDQMEEAPDQQIQASVDQEGFREMAPPEVPGL